MSIEALRKHRTDPSQGDPHVTAHTPHTPPFRDPHLPFAKRIDDLHSHCADRRQNSAQQSH